MVKTKQTSRRSDAKGNLPPLATPRYTGDWETAGQTFYKRFELPMDPQCGDVSYNGTLKYSNRSNRFKLIFSI